MSETNTPDPLRAKQAVMQDVANFLATQGGYSVAALLLSTVKMAELGGLPKLTITVSTGKVEIAIVTTMGEDAVTGTDLPQALHLLYARMEHLARLRRSLSN